MRPRLLPMLALAAACAGDETSDDALCTTDSACPIGRLCFRGSCVVPARFVCVAGDAPVATAPDTLDFGSVGATDLTGSFRLRNRGDCELTVLRARIEGRDPARFACLTCSDLPLTVYPDRETPFNLQLRTGAPGPVEAALVLQTNVPGAPELRVQLVGESSGRPAVAVTPAVVDFGFVPPGETETRVVQVINAGEGASGLNVRAVTLEPTGGSFSVDVTPPLPAALPPALEDPRARLVVTVTAAPTGSADEQAILRIAPGLGEAVEVPVRRTGDPPDISVAPMTLDLGAIVVGEASSAVATVQNRGTSPLRVGLRWAGDGGGGDLTVPLGPPAALRPGQAAQLGVTYRPTGPGSVDDTLVLTSNDPDAPAVRIPVRAAAAAPADDVVSLQMVYAASSDTRLDRDLRDVDLLLESPTGLVCSKAHPVGTEWAPYGVPRWSAQRPEENPERISLNGAAADGEYVVHLSYVEDCASLPTALAATLLGIGADALERYLDQDDEIPLDPVAVGRVITQVCVQRRPIRANVVVKVNGVEVDRVRVDLSEKGQLVRALTLVRRDGRFSARR